MITLRAVLPCSRGFMNLGRSALKNAATEKKSTMHVLQAQTAPLISAYATAHQDRRWYATETKDAAEPLQQQQRIYYGSLAPRMKAVKFFSLTTSLAGLAAQPILMEQGMKLGGTGMAVFLCGFGGFFTFVTPLLLHFITKKYITEIHYNAATDEYTATTVSIILQKIQTKFRPSDVEVPEVPGMFTSFIVDKKAMFVDPSLFEDPEHYVRIMGYDKPIDFKLDLSESGAPKTKAANTPQK